MMSFLGCNKIIASLKFMPLCLTQIQNTFFPKRHPTPSMDPSKQIMMFYIHRYIHKMYYSSLRFRTLVGVKNSKSSHISHIILHCCPAKNGKVKQTWLQAFQAKEKCKLMSSILQEKEIFILPRYRLWRKNNSTCSVILKIFWSKNY